MTQEQTMRAVLGLKPGQRAREYERGETIQAPSRAVKAEQVYFILRCGMHDTAITEVYGAVLAVCASRGKGTVFGSREEATAMKARLESQPYSGKHELVEVNASGCEVHGGRQC